MDRIETLHAFQQLKILADERRLDILRRLMAGPATLTQLGKMLKKSPGWVRHHLKALEMTGLVEMVETDLADRVSGKYYQAKASVLVLQELILPDSQKPVVIFSGSLDPGIEQIASHLAPCSSLLILPNGPLDSLFYLRQGYCHLAGMQLPDGNGEDTRPWIRHLFQDRNISMVTLAHRTQGLIVAPGNPKGLHALPDLARKGITLINRNPGSGTRLWFDKELARIGLPAASIRGYENFVNTHWAAARTVQAGKADAAIGLQSAAWAAQVGFIPLFEERYDLVSLHEQAQLVAPLFEYIQSSAFREALRELPGYNTTHSGECVPIC